MLEIPTHLNAFRDGQESVVDEILTIINDYDYASSEAYREIKRYVNDLKKDLESL